MAGTGPFRRLVARVGASVEAKTFLGMFALLAGCCALVYALVAVSLPRGYRAELEARATAEFHGLVEALGQDGWEAHAADLTAFALRNDASVRVEDEGGAAVFAANYAERDSDASEAPLLACSATFERDGRAYRALASVALVEASRSHAILMGLLPPVAAVVALVSAVGALACARWYTRPLVGICAVARRMARLDMTWTCDARRTDEVGVLAASLNELAARLDRALGDLRAANARLRGDIDREREQERRRVEFFTAVSHELKTPLAVVKGELEGMVYQVGAFKDRDTYLRHALETIDGLEATVHEVLVAARLGGGFEPACEDVDLAALVRACCERVRVAAEAKGLRMTVDADPAARCAGDARLLAKALANVVDNAVAYAPDGAAVSVTLRNGRLAVENGGAHLDEDDLARVFEPFYRVEKSRSRNAGGSGLGLYITKTVLDRHGVACHMENTAAGVRFVAELGAAGAEGASRDGAG